MSDSGRPSFDLSPERHALLEAMLREHGLDTSTGQRIPRRAGAGPIPLSFAQQRLWFLDQLVPENPFYNLPTALPILLPLNTAMLERSVNEIVRRHEALRTTFAIEDGQPVQLVAPALAVPLPVTDLSPLPRAEQEAEVLRLAAEEALRPFDLARGPLLRAALLRLGVSEFVFLLTLHHIIADGWSIGVFFQELWSLYAAFVTGKRSPLPELPIQYGDFALWERAWLQGEVLDRQLAYWRGALAGLPTLQLSTDYPRPPIQTYRGAYHALVFPPHLAAALRALGQREEVTLFMTLLAAFQTLLHRYSGQDDIVVGMPIAGRNRAETEPLIGFFVNTLVLRGDLRGNPSFQELLRRMREVTLGAYAHQDLPFAKLVEELQPERDLSRNPLFQVLFQLFNAPTMTRPASGTNQPVLEVPRGTAKADLYLELWEGAEEVGGGFEYNTDLFSPATIERMARHFQMLLEGIVADPRRRLGDLPLLSAAERRELLVEWNDTRTEYPAASCIHELVEAQAAQTPDAIALQMTTDHPPATNGADLAFSLHLTYAELNERANQLAHYLRARGVGPEVLVGLCMERSVELIIALLGVLKAGGAYLPLDPSYPPERLAFMLEDAGTQIVLTATTDDRPPITDHRPPTTDDERSGTLSPCHLVTLSPCQGIVVDLVRDWPAIAQQPRTAPESGATPDNLAYVIYTSGSTGTPKGVGALHRGVVRLVKATNYASLSAEEVFLQLAPVSFDASTFEIWGALLNGARLVLFPGDTPSLEELGRALGRHSVTTLWLTAGLFHQMVEGQLERLRPLRQLLAGGDALSAAHVQRLVQARAVGRLINGYGPTENTTFTCCFTLDEPAAPGASVPIGRPIANTQVFILDRWLRPVPPGVPGELHIGGDGLARGYLGRPELTAERFIPNPFLKDEGGGMKDESDSFFLHPSSFRLYKTGDLARYRQDGAIEFLGRIDQQVKVRGFRVEPGEIEAALLDHPAVQDAVVLARDDSAGGRRLVAYFIPTNDQRPTTNEAAPSSLVVGRSPLVAELRTFLAARLPEYMVPAAFVLLDALPLTPNGKVDRHALPAPELSRATMAEEYVAPRTPLEAELARIWAELLRVDQVGIHDNFFTDLGGHSLVGTQVISRVRETFRIELPLRSLFEAPTLAAFAPIVEQRRAEQGEAHVDSIRSASRVAIEQLSDEEVDAWLMQMLGEEEGIE